MPTHHEACVLPHKRDALFKIIMEVETYPEFLPWLKSARVYDKKNESFMADLTIGYGPLCEMYTSKVTFEDNMWVKAECVKGPFKILRTEWILEDHESGGTKVTLSIIYEFSSFILQKLLSSVLHEASLKIMQAFKDRAWDRAA